jgi:hypothetical protein
MHELVKNEKKKERRARPLLQTRTGLNALSDRVPLTEKERSAARRAAMAQLPHRRPEPRSLMVWGNGNKVRRIFFFFFFFFCNLFYGS